MAKFRTCEFCGDTLDYGERCSCQDTAEPSAAKPPYGSGVPLAGKKEDPAADALEAAVREGIQAEVTILLEKKAGEDLFRRKIEATSASAALNGIAILIAEYSKLTEVPVVRVLALLAATMTAPGIREERAERGA